VATIHPYDSLERFALTQTQQVRIKETNV